ncbi:MAG: NFACT family protein [Acidobacteriota bacterium]
MHQETIQEIVAELRSVLSDRFMGKIFQITPFSLAIDFGRRDSGYLFLSVNPALASIYLIQRRARELEQKSIAPLLFVQAMRASLGGGKLVSINKDDSERVVRLSFSVEDEIGVRNDVLLVAQLTGRSSNLFLINGAGHITHALRAPKGEGQQIGDQYQAPPPQCLPAAKSQREESALQRGTFSSLSAAADSYYHQLELAQDFSTRARVIRERLRKEIGQRNKLQVNLKRDLEAHGNSEQHKRVGDLLMANIATAKRAGNKVLVKDYYTDGMPEIELEIDEHASLQDEAGRYFSRYTKSKRAGEEIASRLSQLVGEAIKLQTRAAELETIIASGDAEGLAKFEGAKATAKSSTRKKKLAEKLPGIRRYRSSDGYEILVGRAAQTNDRLTFSVARPHDLWLHAADYPGSHVVVRNQTRSDIPHRTVIEAAQLAAKFSQAGDDSKVTVHYTPRKFLSKPKGAAPGLVRMSTFKTLTVQPAEGIPRL